MSKLQANNTLHVGSKLSADEDMQLLAKYIITR